MLEEKFAKYIRENALIADRERILLTVSGGVDSMVMLNLFARAGYNIGVAHCNFQLRGEESDEDEVLVEKEAAKWNLPFYNRRFATKQEMEQTGESVQMAARRLRYAWFNELCTDEGYDLISVAHHADDSIETFFINLLRGTGLKGLTGINVVNGRIIRPLLFASRHEITDYAMSNHIPFREDSSNRSTKYLRNKIRLGIVPRLREISPKFTETMSTDLKRLTDAQLFINHAIEKVEATVVDHFGGEDRINPSKIDAAYPEQFVIYELMSRSYGFKGDVIDSLCKALRSATSTGKRFYSRDFVAFIDRGSIVVSRLKEEDDCLIEVEQEQAKAYCGNSALYFETLDIDRVESLQQPENIAQLDADRLKYPLQLRRWHEGDRFTPFGMTGEKKVSDFLIDGKVSLSEKRRQFVLLSEGKIVWIVGRRIDDRYRVGSKTENVLKITQEII
ncbi:MAG: tRNA lysidine(34) synthetase TilS [Tidjanibacter sp.]|nr:tRNA lysidine(34) synthetase TilS [Tidjanibacter sp.]